MSDDAVSCAGALIVDDDGRIFVQRRSPQRRLFPNRWDIVGGVLQEGESVDDALRREIAEETGWQLAMVLAPVGEVSFLGEHDELLVEEDFLVRVDGDLTRPRLEDGKSTEYCWVSESELHVVDDGRVAGDVLLRDILEAGFATIKRHGL